jgi:hypothetical protein
MVEGARAIQSGLPWHGLCLSKFQKSVNHYFDDFEQRPSFHERNPEICLHYYINGLHLQTFSRKDQEYGAGGIGVPR